MRIRKTITLLIIVGLFVLPFMEISSIQEVSAEDFEPPTLTPGEDDNPAVVDEGLILEPRPFAENSQDIVETQVLTGQTPEGVIPPGSVEVLIPAFQSEGGVDTNAGSQSRAESSYFVHKGITATSGPDILILSADDDSDGDSPIQAILQAYGDLGTVDIYDARYVIPPLSLLKAYDVVLTWANYAFADEVIIGDMLADYVDLGGKVINLTWSFGGVGNNLSGRFITQNYTAIRSVSFVSTPECLDYYNTSSPIMFGITHACSNWYSTGTYLTSGSSMVAEYGDGELLIATKDDRSVVSINGYVGYAGIWYGRLADMVHNAIWWLHDTTSCGSYGIDHGPLVTHLAGGYIGADASALQTSLFMSVFGFGNQYSLGLRLADEFEVTDPIGWLVDYFTFFEYQTGSTLDSPITGVYYQVWDGPPDNSASSVVFGNLTTNRLIDTYYTNIYRVLDTDMLNQSKPVMSVVAEAGLYLPPGTYWLDWMVDSLVPSGTFAPPITINGQTSTGNALQYISSWGPALDSGTSTQQGMPFILQGYVPDSLWNQSLSNFDQTAWVDQEFPDFPKYSSYLADDFYVHTQWKLNSIFVPGNLWGGTTTLFDAIDLTFMIFEDDGGMPAGDPEGGGAPPIWAAPLSPYDYHIVINPGSGGMTSNVEYYLHNPVTLPQGRYWLIFYPTMEWSYYGQYGRQPSETPYGYVGKFINPGGDFGYGTFWQDWTVLGPPQHDIAFRLGGTDMFIYLPLITK